MFNDQRCLILELEIGSDVPKLELNKSIFVIQNGFLEIIKCDDVKFT
jgi:hypothetical protein